MLTAGKSLMAEGMEMVVDDDNIATVVLNNGENRVRLSYVNAWNTILDEIERDTSIRGLIITGTDKYFSLGLDLEYLKTQPPKYFQQTRESLNNLHRRLLLLSIPTVAVINGHAYGAGAFLCLACDYRVMRSDRGWLCWPEVALGMQIKSDNYTILRAKIPVGRPLREAIVFGKQLSGKEAHKLQIVDVICQNDELLPTGKTLIVEALGKRGIDRQALANMKEDMYIPEPVVITPKL